MPTLMRSFLWTPALVASLLAAAWPAAAVPTTTTCTPDEVGSFAAYVYVRCAAAVGGITTFATPTSDPTHAARILSVLSTAQVAGRTLRLTYDPADQSGPSFGCTMRDCRPLVGAVFGK